MTTQLITAALATFVWTAANAAQLPATAGSDPRVRLTDYHAYEVTQIAVRRGTVTRIVLADDEKISPDGASTGFPADCSKPELEWCLRSEPGSSQILVKPREGATHNNLELRTDKRDYSFDFKVLPDAGTGAGRRRPASGDLPMYRVIFRYPAPLPAAAGSPPTLSATPAQPTPPSAQDTLRTAQPTPRNWQYSIQSMPGSEDISPDLVFDDGRFTYFQFPANREMPTIFYISPAGEEGRVNFHIDDAAPDIVVVERMSRRFALRLGKAAVGIWNDAFDPYGVAPRDGTTVDGVMRTIR